MSPVPPGLPDDPAAPDVRVSVQVQHLPQHSVPGRQLFTYVIVIENHADDTWQVMARHWSITDGAGRVTEVEGEGVVGEQPLIPAGGSFTYDSFVTVEATPGRMRGWYTLRNAWGQGARVPIPEFLLDVPGQRVLN